MSDDEWNDFVERFARETATAAVPDPVSAGRRRRRWPWAVGAATVVAAAVVASVVLRHASPSRGDVVATGAPAAPASASASAAPAAERAMVPLAEAFPEQVGSGSGAYTKVAAATLESCTEPDLVGPRLIGMIEASAGCVGEETALYKDAHDNQFSLAAFTMKDPVDTVKLVTELGMAFDDYEVGTQAPPPGSGLRTLPADSGLVQSFTGQGRTMVVGLAQWSDGRVGDYQTLENTLQPLLKAVSANVADYETAR
ncbi:hypothetical protein [Streptomyces sp. NPDC021020]|uniref:hypothetical protein n=1 Tax=Streptomyces sp. NPDC021020 TaxID=3365109 RepID=UPI00379F8EF0